MKRPRRTNLFLVTLLLIWFLADAQRVRQSAADALKLCAASVIPALFPFLVVTGLLISLGFGAWASPLLAPLMTDLYRLPGSAGSALLLGLLGGYPVGARTAADLYRLGYLTKDETERLLTFCNNANPAFLISVLGIGVFHSTRAGIWLLLIHVLSALLTGLCFRARAVIRNPTPSRVSADAPTPFHTPNAPRNPTPSRVSDATPRKPSPSDMSDTPPRKPSPFDASDATTRKPSPSDAPDNATKRKPPPSDAPRKPIPSDAPRKPIPSDAPPVFFPAFADAVSNAASVMLRVCAFVVFFSVLVRPLKVWNHPAAAPLVGSLELFSLTPLLTPDAHGFLLASVCAGWGGLSALGQTAAVLERDRLNIRYCALGKLLQALFSALLAALVIRFFGVPS